MNTALRRLTSISGIIVLGVTFVAIGYHVSVHLGRAARSVDPALVMSNKEYVELELDLLRTVAGVIAGMLLLSGAVVAWRNLKVAISSLEHARETSLREFALAQQGQITDRFARAVELLGSTRNGGHGQLEPNTEARLGAIYALERIARDSPRDHRQIVEVLAAYVRENATWRNAPDCIETDGLPNHVQAALSVLGRLPATEENVVMDLTGTDLRKARLPSANFTRAVFVRSCLAGADFRGAEMPHSFWNNACLKGVHFSGANLCHATLRGAVLDGAFLGHTNFERADLGDVSFVGAHHGADFTHAYLVGAKLQGASLGNCLEADLRGADLRDARLTGANLTRAKLTRANLDGADLKGARLRESLLDNTSLVGQNLDGADLSNATLRGADLSNVTMKRTSLNEADLTDADLTGANLHGAFLFGANLTNTTLVGVDFSGARMTAANLSGARLERCNMSDVIDLTREQVWAAASFRDCIIPDHLTAQLKQRSEGT